MQAVILAGGRGERLRPLTDTVPKPMVKVGETPFLLLLLNLLKKYDLRKILLCAGYKANVIKDFFGDGSKYGLSIEYSVEPEFLGTAGALKHAADLLEDEFLLLNGDTYIDLDYNNFISFAKRMNKVCTMLVYNGSNNDVQFNLKIDSINMIEDYSKNPKHSFNATDAGIYFVKKGILDYIHTQKSSLEPDVFLDLISAKQLAGFPTKTRFYDIGNMDRLHLFSREFEKQ
jgi:NDP-sugar pyrophosphorylase family protein